MSLTLDSVSSPVIDGRCAGCGRFISRNESHFHGPPRKFRGPARVHLWAEGGGCVTRCDQVSWAHILITHRFAREEYGKLFSDLDDLDRQDILRRFPVDDGVVQRGRWTVQRPGSDYGQLWYPLPDGARGPGITTAVVW